MRFPYDLGAYIGRFGPFTLAHLADLRFGLERCTRMVVLVGSTNRPRSYRMPFTYGERVAMIRASLNAAENARVDIVSIEDTASNAAWVASVAAAVRGASLACPALKPRVALIGHVKDATSAYLGWFPEWTFVAAPAYGDLSATQIRAALFKPDQTTGDRAFIFNNLPGGTLEILGEFAPTPDFAEVTAEYGFIAGYREGYAKLDAAGRPVPSFPPVFVTVDTVVVCANHVLMIRRGKHPGKGLWALPGGFLDPGERLDAAWARELVEETRIGVTAAHLRANHHGSAVFDDPHRDARGRVITHANIVVLPDETLPSIEAADDAVHAEWIPLSALDPQQTYSDHLLIIHSLLQTYDDR